MCFVIIDPGELRESIRRADRRRAAVGLPVADATESAVRALAAARLGARRVRRPDRCAFTSCLFLCVCVCVCVYVCMCVCV